MSAFCASGVGAEGIEASHGLSRERRRSRIESGNCTEHAREQGRKPRENVPPMIAGRVLFRRLMMAVGLTALAGSAFGQTPAVQPPDPLTFQVDVIASTPLPGVELTLDKMPSPVQTAIARDIEAAGSLNLPDFLNRRLNGVYVNEVQGNPFQADVNYRGYTASPLLGTPQGLSIFMDGVRLNQPFGEVVSWDLIPQMAIASMTLMPGSNPLFGLNTLGGALAIQTKDGKSSAGTTLQASYGSNLRRAIELEHGGSNSRGWNWYVAGNLFAEDGWRQHSPSDVRQFFGRIDWNSARARLDLSSSLADTALTGNGVQDQRLLDRAYTSVYTSPDDTNNRAGLVNLGWQFRKNPLLIVSSNAYFRGIGTRTLNGDVNEESLHQALDQPNLAERNALAAAGYSGVPAGGASAANTPFPSWRCIA